MTDDEAPAAQTRERILAAACAIARDGDASRVSVRGVATRAGVGMGTLRYHFPTQRALLDAVLDTLYQEALPDERIRDRSVPPAQRLLECLGHLLAPVGTGDQAREVWARLFHAFIDPAAPEERRTGYVELERAARHRVESWLSILVEEGALARGDNTERAALLLAVVNGLTVQRALPSAASALDVETAVLRAAISSLPLSPLG